MTTWTPPRTWVTGEVVTDPEMNGEIRDNLKFLYAARGVRAYKSGAQTVGSGNTDAVSFDSEENDTDGLHSVTSLTSRFVANIAGYWRATFAAVVDADGTQHNDHFTCFLRKNAGGSSGGGTQLDAKTYPAHAAPQSGRADYWGFLNAGDYIEAFFASFNEARDLGSGLSGTSMIFVWAGG